MINVLQIVSMSAVFSAPPTSLSRLFPDYDIPALVLSQEVDGGLPLQCCTRIVVSMCVQLYCRAV